MNIDTYEALWAEIGKILGYIVIMGLVIIGIGAVATVVGWGVILLITSIW